MLRTIKHRVRRSARLFEFRARSIGKTRFLCPICLYRGPLRDLHAKTGVRAHAQCPRCGAVERHRLQRHVVGELLRDPSFLGSRMLHFAPEPFFQPWFRERFAHYESADLIRTDVDHNVDLQKLPFADATYDFVFASHVLEHVPDDVKAIAEIARVLRLGGIAVLPVPIVSEHTVEYPKANPHEAFHMPAPGRDYRKRLEANFLRVDWVCSDRAPSEIQPYIYEDRTIWPNAESPLRPGMTGRRHQDYVPVCYA